MRDEIDVKKKEMKVDGLFWFGDGVFRLRPFPFLEYPFFLSLQATEFTSSKYSTECWRVAAQSSTSLSGCLTVQVLCRGENPLTGTGGYIGLV